LLVDAPGLRAGEERAVRRAAAPPPLVMPAIVPGWEACLCRCHRRRRRKRALSPPFLFRTAPSSHRRRASRRRRAPERRAAGLLGPVLYAHEHVPPTRAQHLNRLDALTTVRTHAGPPQAGAVPAPCAAAGPSSAAEGKSRSRQPKRGKPQLNASSRP
jgi:hypothetical protein